MSSESEHIDALSRGLVATDAGRRVGWARAFAAESSKDDLSRQINVLRAERDIMRAAASFMFGFMRTYLDRRGDSQMAQEALSRWKVDVHRVLDDEVIGAGREAANRVGALDEAAKDRREQATAEKKSRSNKSNRDFRAAREKERRDLAERYGFPNQAAMLNYLRAYEESASERSS